MAGLPHATLTYGGGSVIATLIDTWTHGLPGVALDYVLVGATSLVGLKHGEAGPAQYKRWPITTLWTLLAMGVAITVLFRAIDTVVGFNASTHLGVLAYGLALAGGYGAGRYYWATRGALPDTITMRGAIVLDGGTGPRVLRKYADQMRRRREALPLTLAGVGVHVDDEGKHFKLLGTTGTGKSTVMRELLHGALRRGDRAVITDPDGGYLARFYDPARGDVILNPFDARSAKWNLFAELKNAYDVDELAQAFIPDRGVDPTWTEFARTLFTAVTGQAQALGVTDVGELYRLLVAAPKAELKALVAGTPATPFLEAGSDKLFQGTRSTVTAAVKSLDFIRAQQGPLFSVREWVKSGRGVLFLPYQADQIAALKAIISIWMRLAIFQTMSLGEGDHRIWFAVDELDALGAINGLPDALTRLRKFGGRCVLGLQSIAQASTNYGAGVAQSLIENCGNTLILRCSASEGGGTAQYASKLIGEREVLRFVHSSSHSRGGRFQGGHSSESTSEQTATECAVMAAEIEQLPDRSGFVKFASEPAWLRVGFPVYELPRVAAPFVARQ